MKRAHIQIKNFSGDWVTVKTVPLSDQLISKDCEAVQKSYKKDVRALDDNGLMIQYLAFQK